MKNIHVAARFETPEALETALWDLRRLGAVRCTGDRTPWRQSAGAVVHISVREADASMARAVLRRAGGEISPS